MSGEEESEYRKINILISAYNEEKNIEDTISKIFQNIDNEYIKNIYISDDGSTDNTLSILQSLQDKYSKIIIEKNNRIGKPNALQKIVDKYNLCSNDNILVLMDANIELDSGCLSSMMQKLKQDTSIGIIGASVNPQNEIENLESEYILRENKIKSEESRTTGYTVGTFGACYAMKGELFRTMPSHFITDDLFHTFSVISQKKRVLYDMDIRVFEKIKLDISNEFKRKKRYAAGNFQILFYFWKLLLPWNSSLGFVHNYFFHKIIRWTSPVLFFSFWMMGFARLFGDYSKIISVGGTMICLFLFINYIFQKREIPILGMRIYYFLMMNLAILIGFFDYLKGVKSNVWERSERV